MVKYQRNLVALSVIAAPVAMGVAMILAGYAQTHPTWWQAAVHLAVLGGISIMIYGVNIQALPKHSGKQWRSPLLVALQIFAGIAGGWLTAFGYGLRRDQLIDVGNWLALLGACLFMLNLMLLFSQPGPRPPRIAWAARDHHQRVDRLAIPFTMISGMMVVAGTGVGVLLRYWSPQQGRWDLVWGHLLLVGFFFGMASGTSYHMLGRWTGRQYPSLRLIGVHLVAYVISLPAMVIALGADSDWLFFIGGPLMAISMAAWLGSTLPVAWHLSPAARMGIAFAGIFLIVGVSLGVMFAIDPATGPRLRSTHVMANLFGFAGLLISGFGYRYIPQLAGEDTVAMPQLHALQIAMMVVGCSVGTMFMGLRMYGHLEASLVIWPCIIAGLGMLLFAAMAGKTFLNTQTQSVSGDLVESYGQH